MVEIKEMMKSGCICPFSGRNADGSKTVLFSYRRWNAEKFSALDFVVLIVYIVTTVLKEEETQISGVSLVYDFTNASLKHMMSPADFVDYMKLNKYCSSARLKSVLIMNLPSFAKTLLQIAKPMLGEKLSKRIFLVDDLKNHIDVENLPIELGGKTKSIDEMMQDFYELKLKYSDEFDKTWYSNVDAKKDDMERIWSNSNNEISGSFRKLEID